MGVCCESLKAWWFGSKKLEAMHRIALEGPYENFDDIIEEASSLWRIKLSTSSYMLTLHVISIMQVRFFVDSITLVMFPNSKDVD